MTGPHIARAGVVASIVLLVGLPARGQICIGDCNADQRVDITELTSMIAGVLAGSPLACPEACSGEGCLGDLVVAVGHALTGCPAQQADGAACAVDADCRSNRCRQRCCAQPCAADECCDASGACAAAAACAEALPPGTACENDAACASLVCDPFDAICCVRRCNTSTEYCTPEGRCREFGLRVANGQTCGSDFDCQSGHCDSHAQVCCNRRCDPFREACENGRCVVHLPRPPTRRPTHPVVDSLNSVD